MASRCRSRSSIARALQLNGRNPTLLIGYGAYGISFGAGYDARLLAWLERGGVVALANVRGSGAFGEEWYLAGFEATKPNTWKDGIAAARYLIDGKYASPATLGVLGGSAGGRFVGRAVTSAPDLFAAAIFDVGVLDAVRPRNRPTASPISPNSVRPRTRSNSPRCWR